MAVIKLKESELKVGDKVYDSDPIENVATCFLLVEIKENGDLKMKHLSGDIDGYFSNGEGYYLFSSIFSTIWYKVEETLKPENYPLWIKLRAEVIKHFHDTYNPDKFTGQGYNMLYAIKVAESELKNSIIDQNFIISLDEMLLNSLDECVELVVKRQNEYIKRLISRY